MTGREIVAEDWKADAAHRTRLRIGAWVGTLVAATAGVIALGLGTHIGGGARAPLMILGGALVALGFVYGTAIYMRRIDEQERDANLWSAYIGFCLYIALYMIRGLWFYATGSVPFSHDVIFVVTLAVGLAVFLWRKFR